MEFKIKGGGSKKDHLFGKDTTLFKFQFNEIYHRVYGKWLIENNQRYAYSTKVFFLENNTIQINEKVFL